MDRLNVVVLYHVVSNAGVFDHVAFQALSVSWRKVCMFSRSTRSATTQDHNRRRNPREFLFQRPNGVGGTCRQ